RVRAAQLGIRPGLASQRWVCDAQRNTNSPPAALLCRVWPAHPSSERRNETRLPDADETGPVRSLQAQVFKPMSVHRELLLIFAGVCGALTLATCIACIVQRRFSEPKWRPVINNLTARIRAWWVMVIALGLALIIGSGAVMLLFAAVSLAALREFITLTRTRRADHAALLLTFLVVAPFQYWLIWVNWYGLFAVFIPVYALLIVPMASVVVPDTTNFLTRTSETQCATIVCIYCISHVPALLILDIPGYRGRAALLVVFM